MIKPGELQQKAREAKVRDQQIEKDYILSWILWGVSQHEELSGAIVFKGGTVLKKVYFDNYRFSEDLDFTLVDSSTVTNEQIFAWFEESFAVVREETNIPLAIIDNNEHEDSGINFYISYLGPLGGQGANKKVKVDISRSEQLQFNPVKLPVHLSYSDQDDHQLLCYPLEEVLVEKLRAVIQRMQARDFYDIWYLLEHHQMEVAYLLNEFSAKCAAKGLNASDFPDRLTARLPQYKSRWILSMNEQIHNLPDFEQVVREVQRHLKKVKF